MPKISTPAAKKGKAAVPAAAKPAQAPRPRRAARPGNPSFAGYEYQIAVTAWVALNLMLAKDGTQELVIEPQSQEDIEAEVRDPGTASLGVEASLGKIDLIVQIKSRATSPWSAKSFAEIILGKIKGDKGKAGPGARTRPLEMLKAVPSRRYVFVTNESLEPALRPHASDGLLDIPDVTQLPPFARSGTSASAQRALAPRIGLCAGITDEVLASRIAELLAMYGHVSNKSAQSACLRDLQDEIRMRMMGRAEGRLTKTDLLDIVRRHGGSALPSKAMDHYVKPSSYDDIRASLDNRHAVVIVGHSGTGKTLTADMLEVELMGLRAPFSVVTEEGGPSRVKHEMTRQARLLLHLRDPWGTNRVEPEADRWANELPKLLTSASADRKFLVTSRMDVLQDAGSALSKQLTQYIVRIDAEHYGPARLSEIYELMCRGLAGHALDLANTYRRQALKSLTRPYEIDRFIYALSNEKPEKTRPLCDLIKESQIDAISSVVADQVAGMANGGVACAAVMWAMLGARGAVPVDLIPKLRRWLRRQNDALNLPLDAFVDTMVHARNLKRDGMVITNYHPRVEDGLLMALKKSPGDVEHVLAALVDALVSSDEADVDWGVETALKVLRNARRLPGIEMQLAGTTHQRLDAFLQSQANLATTAGAYSAALDDLAQYGSRRHLQSRLARFLVQGALRRTGFFKNSWQAPAIGKAELQQLYADPHSVSLVSRFVREVLPTSETSYGTAFVDLLQVMEPNLVPEFSQAIDEILSLGGVAQSIDGVVYGFCQSSPPDFDSVIERAARANAQVDLWMEKFSKNLRAAEEHEVDASVANHDVEEPAERYYNSTEVLLSVASLRREREGVAWVEAHPHRSLMISALLDGFEHLRENFPQEQLRALAAWADGWNRNIAWRLANDHWDEGLLPLLETEICRTDTDCDHLRERLVQCAITSGILDDAGRLALLIGHMAPRRRIEFVYEILATNARQDERAEAEIATRAARAMRVVALLEPAQASLTAGIIALQQGCDLRTAVLGFSSDARDLLASMLPVLKGAPAAVLCRLAAAARISPIAVAQQLLSTDDAAEGMASIQALAAYGGSEALAAIRVGLTNGRYQVRRLAMETLIDLDLDGDRALILTMARDRGADVRLRWAELMGALKWPEAVEPLVALLADRRNFSGHSGHFAGPHWAHYAVARCAASSLGRYDELPPSAVDALLAAGVDCEEDPLAECAALLALGTRDDPRVTPALMEALHACGLNGAPSYKPKSQAAGWALFDRTQAGLLALGPADETAFLKLCKNGTAELAAPVIASIACLGGDIARSLNTLLASSATHERLVLFCVTAHLAGNSFDGDIPVPLHLLGVPAKKSLKHLSPRLREELEAWSRSLDPSRDVEGTTSWILSRACSLSSSHEDFDPRSLLLPKQIGVLTMRSLTEGAEEVSDAYP